MSLCPFATHRLLPESETQPVIKPRAVILHSAAGRGSLYEFFRTGSNLESHFWVASNGKIEQYIDTQVRADANLNANGFAISVETESSPQATERWTPAQAEAIVRLVSWCCETHGIPRQQIPTWDGAGIGWHIMFGSPGPWTPVAKSCPGPARVAQARDEIIPAVAAGGAPTPQPPKDWFDMATEAELRKIIGEELDKRLDPDGKGNLLVRIRNSVAATEKRVVDLVTGARPGKD